MRKCLLSVCDHRERSREDLRFSGLTGFLCCHEIDICFTVSI